MRLKCDVHPWMGAWLHVMPDPCHAITGADGTFEIRGVPAGPVELVGWHEVLGTVTVRATLEPGATLDQDLALPGATGAP